MNQQWYVDSFYSKEIVGILDRIIVIGGDSSKVVLDISAADSKFNTTYGFTCVDEEFYSIAKAECIVRKPGMSRTMQFCLKPDSCGTYEINFCGAYD